MTARPSQHAVEALALFYPSADGRSVIDEVGRGVEVEPATAVAMVGRSRHRPGSTYVLHRERTGLFVIAVDRTVVTFLRFYALEQHQLAARLWPGGDPPTTVEPTWARTRRPENIHAPGDPGDILVTSAVRDAIGLPKVEIAAWVRTAIDTGTLRPPGDRRASLPLAGLLTFHGVEIGVVLEATRIRVIGLPPASPSDATRAAREEARAARKAADAERRRSAADLLAAAALRKRGWTCLPPHPTTPESP